MFYSHITHIILSSGLEIRFSEIFYYSKHICFFYKTNIGVDIGYKVQQKDMVQSNHISYF